MKKFNPIYRIFQYINRHFISSSEGLQKALQSRLQEFYTQTKDYPAFESETEKPEFWNPIKHELLHLLENKQQCCILEFGAGKTGFGNFLGELRNKVSFNTQDITDANRDHLSIVSDNAHFGPITSINQKFDLIFSTFVWEHISNPEETLSHMLGLLNPGGSLFIVSPRYDFPFYLSNSANHLSLAQKCAISLWLLFRRVKSFLLQKPDFIIHLDPAVFHIPFHRDTDAIHWVSYLDLLLSIPDNCTITRLFSRTQKSLRGKFWERFLLLNIKIKKNEMAGK